MIWTKYDVVFSYADEDKEIVREITLAMRNQGIDYFDFYEKDNWGNLLMDVTLEHYINKTHCVLAVISKNYIGKPWPNIELKLAQVAAKKGKLIVLALFLDNTKIDELPSSTLHKKWQNNPGEIAAKIANAIKPVKWAWNRKRLMLLSIVLLCLGLAGWFLNMQQQKDGTNTTPAGKDSVDQGGNAQANHDSIPQEPIIIKPNTPVTQPGNGRITAGKKHLPGDFIISGMVTENGTGRLLDSVEVTTDSGHRTYTKQGSFVIEMPGMIKTNGSYTKPVKIFLTKKGYDNASLTEVVLIDTAHTNHATEATLTKLN